MKTSYAHQKEETVREWEAATLRLSETNVLIAEINKQKAAMRREGRPTPKVNKCLSEAVTMREELKRKVSALNEKIRYINSKLKNQKPFSDYVVDVCRRDFDADTFKYLIAEAKKIQVGEAT